MSKTSQNNMFFMYVARQHVSGVIIPEWSIQRDENNNRVFFCFVDVFESEKQSVLMLYVSPETT